MFGPRQIQLYRTLWSMWGMSHPRAADRPRATPPRLGYIIDLSAGHISKVVFGESGAYAIRVKPLSSSVDTLVYELISLKKTEDVMT